MSALVQSLSHAPAMIQFMAITAVVGVVVPALVALFVWKRQR